MAIITEVYRGKSDFLSATYMQCNYVKTARKTELNVLWHSTDFPSGLSVLFLSVL